MYNRVLIYLILILISIYLHNRTKSEEVKKKYTIKIILIEILHHFISNYATFGSILFGYHKIHLTVLLAIGALWVISKDYTCPLTIYCNERTGQEDVKDFRDLNYHLLELFNLNITAMLVVIIIYDLYFIFKNN